MTSRSLEAYLVDYEATREDLRSLESVRVNVVGFALASLTVLGVVAWRDCRVRALVAECAVGEQHKLADLILAATPLIPLALVSYLVLNGTTQVLKSFYSRQLERRISDALEAESSGATLHPMWMEIEVQATRLSGRGGVLSPLVAILACAAAVIFGGFTAVIFLALDGSWRLAVGLFYAAGAVVLLRLSWLSVRSGRRLYLELESQAAQEFRNVLRHQQPTPLIFLLLPRRGVDFIFKGAFVVAGMFVAIGLIVSFGPVVAPGLEVQTSGRQISLLIAVVVIFEFVLYQARYLLNDYRGLEQDLARRRPGQEGRLSSYLVRSDESPVLTPEVERRALRLTLIGVVARLLVFVALAMVFPPPLDRALLIAGGATLLVALVYDSLRDAEPRTERGSRAVALALHVIVGAGYAIRFSLGFVAAREVFDLPLSNRGHWLGVLFCWLFGMFLVVLTWALEAMSYVDAEVYANQRLDNASNVKVADALWRKPQLAVQLRYMGLGPGISTRQPDLERSLAGGRTAYLTHGDGACAWRVVPTLLVSAAAWAWPAALLPIGANWVVAFAMTGLLVGNLLWPGGSAVRVGAGVVGGTIALVLAIGGVLARHEQPWFPGLKPWWGDLTWTVLLIGPWLAVAGVNAVFRIQSRQQQLDWPKINKARLDRLVNRVAYALVWVGLGPSTAARIRRHPSQPTNTGPR